MGTSYDVLLTQEEYDVYWCWCGVMHEQSLYLYLPLTVLNWWWWRTLVPVLKQALVLLICEQIPFDLFVSSLHVSWIVWVLKIKCLLLLRNCDFHLEWWQKRPNSEMCWCSNGVCVCVCVCVCVQMHLHHFLNADTVASDCYDPFFALKQKGDDSKEAEL